jgi:hypothetical protein
MSGTEGRSLHVEGLVRYPKTSGVAPCRELALRDRNVAGQEENKTLTSGFTSVAAICSSHSVRRSATVRVSAESPHLSSQLSEPCAQAVGISCRSFGG